MISVAKLVRGTVYWSIIVVGGFVVGTLFGIIVGNILQFFTAILLSIIKSIF